MGEIAEVGEGVPATRLGERVVLKPIVSCGACRWCREGAINHCPTGRLVGRDMTGGFAERFAVPAAAAVRLDADRLGRGGHAHGAAGQRGACRVPVRRERRPRLRDRRRPDRRAHGEGRVPVRGRPRADHGSRRPTGCDWPPRRAPRSSRATTRRRPSIDATDGEGADVVIDAAGYEATWAMALRAVRTGGRIQEVGLGSPSGDRRLLRRPRQGGDHHRFLRVGRRRLRARGRTDAGWGDRRRPDGSRRCRSPTVSARSRSSSAAPATSRSC